jgi:hypothetical protein
LTWTLTWGEHLEFLLDLQKATGILPPAIKAMPELLPGLSVFYDAFWDLVRCRPPMPDGPVPISMTEIAAYVGLRQWMPETAIEALTYLRAMDDVWLKFRSDRGDWDPSKKPKSLIDSQTQDLPKNAEEAENPPKATSIEFPNRLPLKKEP